LADTYSDKNTSGEIQMNIGADLGGLFLTAGDIQMNIGEADLGGLFLTAGDIQ
jgi:hypothetical protein